VAFKDVSGSEQIKKFVILATPFTVGGEELTVSLKLRRKVIQSKYRALLEALYQETAMEEKCGE
jgi:long-chain acyl-CoA synthetase